MTVQRIKFGVVGGEFRQALEIKFFTLFGTCSDQIPFQRLLSYTLTPYENASSASFKK